jgi:chorismate synthase
MNTFGLSFRLSIFGESHGDCVGVVIDGCPAGLALCPDDLLADIDRRKPGGPGGTPRHEPDVPEIQSGILNGRTTGAPLTIVFANRNARSEDYETLRDIPRPGHADLVARIKFEGFNDARGGGHFSGRLTLPLVAAGAVARKLLAPATLRATLLEAGGSTDIEKTVRAAGKDEDSVGGLIECRGSGFPPGLGEPFFDAVESLIAHAVLAIPGIAGIEFGAGFAASKMRGSACNDVPVDPRGTTRTNHTGGINGGITNGNELVFRVAVKPPSSIRREQESVDLRTALPVRFSVPGRHDACTALRMPVIIEAAAAIVLADLMLRQQLLSRTAR